MRFNAELKDGANSGLEKVQKFLEPIKKKHPEVSYGDLWVREIIERYWLVTWRLKTWGV